MAAVLTLVANPTFISKVAIPVPGSDPVQVEFTFKHRTRKGFDDFLAKLGGENMPDVDYVLEVATGWGLDDEFNKDNIETLLQNYHGSAAAIATTYTRELMQAKRGNS